jgi:hypothetical protein
MVVFEYIWRLLLWVNEKFELSDPNSVGVMSASGERDINDDQSILSRCWVGGWIAFLL